MQNNNIKYDTSRDYKKLFELLRQGFELVGFRALNILNGSVSDNYSSLIRLRYSDTGKYFDFGGLTFFEEDFDNDALIRICEKNNIQYIPF